MKFAITVSTLLVAAQMFAGCRTGSESTTASEEVEAGSPTADTTDNDQPAADPLLPPSGAKVKNEAWLPDCNDPVAIACTMALNPDELGCVATNGTDTFESKQGNNNCMDGIRVRTQICNKNLNTADFKSACFVKDRARR